MRELQRRGWNGLGKDVRGGWEREETEGRGSVDQ
jgi:hypothetical protein